MCFSKLPTARVLRLSKARSSGCRKMESLTCSGTPEKPTSSSWSSLIAYLTYCAGRTWWILSSWLSSGVLATIPHTRPTFSRSSWTADLSKQSTCRWSWIISRTHLLRSCPGRISKHSPATPSLSSSWSSQRLTSFGEFSATRRSTRKILFQPVSQISRLSRGVSQLRRARHSGSSLAPS